MNNIVSNPKGLLCVIVCITINRVTRSSGAGGPEGGNKMEASPLVVEVRQPGYASMDVRLLCSIERPIKLHEVITILEEEGAVIINANHYVAAHVIFYTIHSRVRAYVAIRSAQTSPRIQVSTNN